MVYEDRSKHSMEQLEKARSPIVKFLTFLGRMSDFILEYLKAELLNTMLSKLVHEDRSKHSM